MTDFEVRPLFEPVEVRSAEGGRLVLSGTAIRYGARSKDLGGFRERVMPGAAAEPIGKGDVLCMAEHRSEFYLGRTSNASLRLFDTSTELRYEVDVPDTDAGRQVAVLAERGDYTGSSFGFRAKPGAVRWTKDDDGTPLRSVHGFRLLRDVGPTIAPAYDTGVAEMVLRRLPEEAELDIEVRSVLEAASRGELAKILDGEWDIPSSDDTDETAVHRRPASWFV